MKKLVLIPALAALALATPGLFDKQLPQDQRVLHALQRLTFGPRQGDAAAVQALGLDKWMELQLHPERIGEDPRVAEKLAPLDSLRMSSAEAAQKYPPRAARARPVPGALKEMLAPEQIQALRNGTPEEKRQVLASLPEDKLDEVAMALPGQVRQQVMASADPVLRRKMIAAAAPAQVLPFDLIEAKLYRAVYSNRQLEEQMVDFWFNHFNVYLNKGADRVLTTAYERDAIRPHVFGKFRDLLEATAESPAMLFYLDNWQSAAPNSLRTKQARGLNENYARELMELHTLGVDGGYTQQDVTEVARCFTGWTIRAPRMGGEFVYNDRMHDKGEKTVLGVNIPAGGGKGDAERVLDLLAGHPATARFISLKLARKFVADEPPAALVDRMAKTFRESGGDIRRVMETMLHSPEFFSEGAWRSKVKTPFETVVSAVRASGAQLDYATPVAQRIADLGQPLYRKVEPTGYASANAEWVNSAALLGRMNFALALASNRLPGVTLDTSRYSEEAPAAARQLLFSEASSGTLDAIARALAKPEQQVTLAGLILGSPEFQRR